LIEEDTIMPFEYILVHHDGAVTTLTINRPERANALSSHAVRELKQAVEATRDRPDTRVVVITGAGERSFVGGADIHELGALDPFRGEQFIRRMHEAFRAIREHPAPVIAAVNGYALGAGLELVMSCDIAIAADHAQLGMPEVKVGLPSVIECALMPSIIGLMRTRELLLTGDNIAAEEAYRMGLVNQVVPLAELPAAVQHMAERLMRNGPRALLLQKELINRWLNLPMDEAIEAGIKSLASAYATDEPQRSIEAFWNRRGKDRRPL
jgi:enoyl-CoA hydratase